jgi:outer membrane protein assembly factor BamB
VVVQTGAMGMMPRAAAAAAATATAMVTALALTACDQGPAPRPPGPASGGAAPARVGGHADWPTYHANARRSGYVAGLPPAGRLGIGWSQRLDGAVYGQPLVIGRTVIAATEHDTVYGLSLSTGRVRWSAHVASPLPLARQPCGDINPIGITSTPVYYRGLVYALAQNGRSGHVLVGLNPVTGRLRYRREVPAPDGRPFFDQQRAALAAGRGRIYVAFGGHAGDCGPYVGSVVGVPAAERGAATRPADVYKVPSKNHAGIWAPGGPVVGPGGTVYVGVGNGDTAPPFDDSDSVTALSPSLRRIGVFAPASWVADNRQDLDLGSLTPVLLSTGQVVTVGKRGVGYLLAARQLGGIGGQLAELRICAAFGGAASIGQTVIIPCASGGPAAVGVSGGKLRMLWRGPAAADGSPVIGGGAVWVTDNQSGVLYRLSLRTGQTVAQLKLGSGLPHFASPSLSGRLVLVGTLHGVVAVTGA